MLYTDTKSRRDEKGAHHTLNDAEVEAHIGHTCLVPTLVYTRQQLAFLPPEPSCNNNQVEVKLQTAIANWPNPKKKSKSIIYHLIQRTHSKLEGDKRGTVGEWRPNKRGSQPAGEGGYSLSPPHLPHAIPCRAILLSVGGAKAVRLHARFDHIDGVDKPPERIPCRSTKEERMTRADLFPLNIPLLHFPLNKHIVTAKIYAVRYCLAI